MSGPNDPQLARMDERLTRLEEAVGFAEYTSEQLSGELRTLGGRITELSRRIDAMDARLGGFAQRLEQQTEGGPSAGDGELA